MEVKLCFKHLCSVLKSSGPASLHFALYDQWCVLGMLISFWLIKY